MEVRQVRFSVDFPEEVVRFTNSEKAKVIKDLSESFLPLLVSAKGQHILKMLIAAKSGMRLVFNGRSLNVQLEIQVVSRTLGCRMARFLGWFGDGEFPIFMLENQIDPIGPAEIIAKMLENVVEQPMPCVSGHVAGPPGRL